MVSTNNWDTVPWAVGGGAKHSVNISRVLAYAAFGGKEGIVGPGDLLVRELANAPGPQVRVAPGACSIKNRAGGIDYECYAGRLIAEDEIDIAATGASGGRHDMIVARVENPHIESEPWPDPADPVVGPYIFTRVISGVAADAERIGDLPAQYQSQTLIPLARIDIPANTYAITQDMIHDVRFMAAPRMLRIQRIINLKDSAPANVLGATDWNVWPDAATWTQRIPDWAVRAQVVGYIAGSRLIDVGPAGGQWVGQLRIQHGTLYTAPVEVNLDVIGGGGATQSAPTMMAADDIAIPADHRGTTRDLTFQGLRRSNEGASLQADWGTTAVIEVTYFEEPDTQGWAP